ncbi:MAG: zinc-dependent metalloprotease [Candidatus Wenzhouxiangella sp. M2_3B_020]
MRTWTRAAAALAAAIFFTTLPLRAETGDEPAGFEDLTGDLERSSGFFDVYGSAESGKVLALLPSAGDDGVLLRFIHALRLTQGLGSNPLGLDRGWGNSGRIIRFRRIGDRVVAEAENHRYRAATDDPLERDAVATSFANSFLWATDVLAEDPEGRPLIDLAGFLTADGLGLARVLSEDGGEFSRVDDRSMPDAGSLLVFPDNVEIDAWITFAGDEPGPEVRATAADANNVTLVQHHSFVRLPDDGYRTRAADPRTGTFTLGFHDYAASLDEPIVRGFAMRHRLQYNEPGDPGSGIREPLVFHVDAGAPERIREALIQGASWWADAFAAAGFDNGFRVEPLPAGAHPLDIRYNVVQWVHRQTRGWSYGGGIIDPRTGEMIKGHVILGSQRVRQDRMIFEGLAGVGATGTGADDDPVELALDRIRQLAAHEVGHALGFGHNFAASANDRASVMDYPAPWIGIDDDGLDFSRAYDRGIGEWDKLTARWLYGEFPPGADEVEQLDAIVDEGIERGLMFVADRHARRVSTAHPQGSVWDNGADAVAELENVIAVRDHALERFGSDRVRTGRPLSELREVLVPIYLYHRYQLAAAAKSLGGLRFEYAQRGGPGETPRPVPAGQQRRALDALLSTLEPDFLDVPDAILGLMPPAYSGYWFGTREETLPGRTEPAFDPFTAAESAADLAFDAILDPVRAERLARQHALDDTLPSFDRVVTATAKRAVDGFSDAEKARSRIIAQRVVARFAAALMELESGDGSPRVRAVARRHLAMLPKRLQEERAEDPFGEWLDNRIERHLDRPAPAREAVDDGPDVPPGSPIGGTVGSGLHQWIAEECWHCGLEGARDQGE